MQGDAPHTFKNISSTIRENMAEVFTMLRRKYHKPVNKYGKTQISTASIQSDKPEGNRFFGRTPENGKRYE